MATPSSIQAGQSIAPTQFENSTFGSQPNFRLSSDGNYNKPDFVIEKILNQNSLRVDAYPTDLPKYHFSIIQNEWKTLQGQLTAERMFRIPFPRELQDKNEVNYDTNFNYLSAVGAAMSEVFGTGATAAASAVGSVIGAVSGMTLNSFKSVTLQVPDFKTHQLSWQFAPKNFQESVIIQKILYALKTGMAPRVGGSTGYQGPGAKLVLGFPKIYTMYFSPNSHWLFKFKPCVLSTLVIDYAGGNPVPAFYKGTSVGGLDGATEQNPPESIIVSTNWIELEYWLNTDYEDDTQFIGAMGGLPTEDPFKPWSYYGYKREVYGPPPPNDGRQVTNNTNVPTRDQSTGTSPLVPDGVYRVGPR